MQRLGKTNKTVDVELDTQIQTLRDTRDKYDNILRLSRALTSHFYHVITTQVLSVTIRWHLPSKFVVELNF